MRGRGRFTSSLAGIGVAILAMAAPTVTEAQGKPNIIFIMGDDIGWFNIGAYHQGIMAGKTPNLDRLAAEGMRFTDYYAEASCTAGRANFITGELPIRTGLTTVGQAGSPLGMPAEAPTIATVLKSMGYETGQFGKNHLGDLNQFLPCVHGFDEFFGYLYHLDAMEDPDHPNYPQALKDQVGPRNMVTCQASDKDDPTVEPRWGKIGKQTIKDEGPLDPGAHEDDRRRYPRAVARVPRRSQEGRQAILHLAQSDAHARRHAPRRQVREDAHVRERLVRGRSRDGAARRRRRGGAGQAQGRRPRRQYHRRVQHGQRDGELHLARRRPDAVRRRQGDGDGGRLPRAGDGPLARQGAGRQGRERDLLGARLVPDLRRRSGQPRHRRRSQEGEADRGHDLQGPPRRLRSDGRADGQGAVEAARGLLLRRVDARRGPHRRLQVPLHRSAERVVGRHGQGRLADPRQPAARSLRAYRSERIAELLPLVRLRVLALRLCEAGGRQVRPDLPRVPADAEGGDLQPGSAEGRAREEDGDAEEPAGGASERDQS